MEYIYFYRAGVIPLEEAEKSYADDIEFWLTRLQMIEEDTSVCTCNLISFIYLLLSRHGLPYLAV